MPPRGSPKGQIDDGARPLFNRGGSEEGTVRKIGQDRPSHQRPYPPSAPKGIPGPERVGVERHRAGLPSRPRRSGPRAKTTFNVVRLMVGRSMDPSYGTLTASPSYGPTWTLAIASRSRLITCAGSGA